MKRTLVSLIILFSLPTMAKKSVIDNNCDGKKIGIVYVNGVWNDKANASSSKDKIVVN